MLDSMILCAVLMKMHREIVLFYWGLCTFAILGYN